MDARDLRAKVARSLQGQQGGRPPLGRDGKEGAQWRDAADGGGGAARSRRLHRRIAAHLSKFSSLQRASWVTSDIMACPRVLLSFFFNVPATTENSSAWLVEE